MRNSLNAVNRDEDPEMRIATLLIVCALVAAVPAAAKQLIPVDLELLLAVDISGSVDPAEGKLQRAGYVSALSSRPVIAAIRSGVLRRIAIAYVEWADSHRQHMVVGWTLIDSEKSAYAFADKLDSAPISRGRFTSISSMIEYGVPMFDKNEFEGTRRVIDISGDGANNSGLPIIPARDAAIAAGIIINGLPIMNDHPQGFGPQIPNLDLYYENCVIGGPGAFIVVARSFEDFAVAIRKKMILEIADALPLRNIASPLFIPIAGRRYSIAEKRSAPDCSIGERQLDQRLKSMFFLDN